GHILRPVSAAPRFTAPDMHFAHGPDGAALNQLDDPAVVAARMDLRSHLGNALLLGGQLGDDSRLVDIVSQRFLAVDVQAGLERGDGGNRMGMAGVAITTASMPFWSRSWRKSG